MCDFCPARDIHSGHTLSAFEHRGAWIDPPKTWRHMHVGGCQNSGALLGPLNTRCRIKYIKDPKRDHSFNNHPCAVRSGQTVDSLTNHVWVHGCIQHFGLLSASGGTEDMSRPATVSEAERCASTHTFCSKGSRKPSNLNSRTRNATARAPEDHMSIRILNIAWKSQEEGDSRSHF